MRSRWRGDRGGSAIEAALLIAAVALVMLPALFLLGRAVDAAFSKPCDDLPDNACASGARAPVAAEAATATAGRSATTSATRARPTTSTTGWPRT